MIALLTHADTDLASLVSARSFLPDDFPELIGVNLQNISHEAAMDELLNSSLLSARVILLRVLGKPSTIAGFSSLLQFARQRRIFLLPLSGTGEISPELSAIASVDTSLLAEAAAYMQAGGPENVANLCRRLSDKLLMTSFTSAPPIELPAHGIYRRELTQNATIAQWMALRKHKHAVGVIFYRAHWISGNLQFIDALIEALDKVGLDALPVFTSSLKHVSASNLEGEDTTCPSAFKFFHRGSDLLVDAIINTTSFAMADINPDGPTLSGWSVASLSKINLPIVQAIVSGMSLPTWQASARGLSPLDAAMNIVMPEFDGRIASVPISFKELSHSQGIEVSKYVPQQDRIKRLVGLVANLVRLRTTRNAEKKIAFVLTNASSKASQIGNAVGLDAPASLMAVFAAMEKEGYILSNIPKSSDDLIHQLIDKGSYDKDLLTADQCRNALGRVSGSVYSSWFMTLTESQRQKIQAQWGDPPGAAYVHEGDLVIAGLDLGNVVLLLQPPRGYGMDPDAIYHQPDLAPTHHYCAAYFWLANVWKADAIVHMGKHGTLEWLPGKATGLSSDCFPDSVLGDLPLFYPFIINDPGEGCQAKRRSHAVIVDHMTPPMTTADSYGVLNELVQLVDEYYQLELMDPSKLPLLQKQIWQLIEKANLQYDLQHLLDRELLDDDHEHNHEHAHIHDHKRHNDNHDESEDDHEHDHEHDYTSSQDNCANTIADGAYHPEHQERPDQTSLSSMNSFQVSHLIQTIDGYLCELGAAQIRDGLHILGQTPEGEQLLDMLSALTRLRNNRVPSLHEQIALLFDLDLREIAGRQGEVLNKSVRLLDKLAGRPLRTNGDAIETIDVLCHRLLAMLAEDQFEIRSIDGAIDHVFFTGSADDKASIANSDRSINLNNLRGVLFFICQTLVPNLRQSHLEITNLLAGLDGGYVPAGPSGAPTRGMAHILPTGRNFYAVDPGTLPSQSAWLVGEQLASEVLRQFLADTGRYPECTSISMWGTSAMRTHGDDVAEVLALLGVRPIWDGQNRRISGLEVIPLDQLGRPRIDVTVRISGFFRDAFPNLIDLMDEAFKLVIDLDESIDMNFPRKHFFADCQKRCEMGMEATEAEKISAYRIFGSRPGTYGAGILGLIQEKNWHDDNDFAEAYVNWGGYAYTTQEAGCDARSEFCYLLERVEVALHNQDNREHDIFDSDDYLQFHGGMLATIRALSGQNPRGYFGDTKDPANARVRHIEAEALRVFRSRVVNPKWIESIKRHGYKGALELTATVDYLFGYDATAGIMQDWMYKWVTEAYVLDPATRAFLESSNPWALAAISERLLEAIDRGLWEYPEASIHSFLKKTLLQTETLLESRSENTDAVGVVG